MSNLHPTETRYSFIRFRSAWARSCDAPLERGQGAAVTSAPGKPPSRLSLHTRNSSPFESRIPPSGVPHHFLTYTLLPPHFTKKVAGRAVVQLVEARRYKPEGRGFDSRLCYWNFLRNLSGRLNLYQRRVMAGA